MDPPLSLSVCVQYVMLDLNRQDQGWIRRTEIDPGRARPLLLVVNDPENAQATAIYSAGKFDQIMRRTLFGTDEFVSRWL